MVKIECEKCEAVFDMTHDMDSSYYQIRFCSFCGGEIDTTEFNPNDVEDNWDEEDV